ncbi:hypothetical protein NHH03_16330 [Stieleria sp. TO1_6]|uniref:hypothetical protein n=1 Tax=Stieleria tagensis TaxID=2956795 RepID=UPI00209B8B5C|nr:hypothetical protein [Stieleria tagensis]MCO8123318.1 hypothetical protein [Stieleria tagensis]
MIPDAFERTVRIPVQWIDGQWQLIGGGKLPELKPNVCAELFMPAIALAIDEERERWTAGETVVFLTAGTELLAQVNRNRVPGPLKEKALDKPHKTGHPSAYVPIKLLTDVSLSLIPGKKAGLAGGRCRVASLDIEVGSINEALTRISREFEPDRKSFGGSVFLKVFIERDSRLISLDDLRDQRTNVAALEAARPRDRCDSWLELSVSLSRVSDIWNAHQQQLASDAVSQRLVARTQAMPMPAGSNELLEKAASEFFDFRTKTLIHSDAGLIELMDRFHDRIDTTEEIQKLRGLHEAMDRAVLSAYGWQDLALSARCEFLPPPGVKQSRFFRRSAQDEKEMRLRWPDEFGQQVLDRLINLPDVAVDHEDRSQGEVS